MTALQSSVLEKLRKQENQLEKENENLQEEHEDWLDKVRKAKKQNKEK
jgi:FtsZ-binding cell division protein ZapB